MLMECTWCGLQVRGKGPDDPEQEVPCPWCLHRMAGAVTTDEEAG